MSIDPEQLERWERLRKAGIGVYPVEAFEQLASGADGGALDLLALNTGISRMPHGESGLVPPFNLRLHYAKQACVNAGHSMTLIAAAMGEIGNGRKAEARVRARFNQNAETLAHMLTEHGWTED